MPGSWFREEQFTSGHIHQQFPSLELFSFFCEFFSETETTDAFFLAAHNSFTKHLDHGTRVTYSAGLARLTSLR